MGNLNCFPAEDEPQTITNPPAEKELFKSRKKSEAPEEAEAEAGKRTTPGEEVDALFAKIDTNEDGTLEAAELQQIYELCGVSLSLKEVEEKIAEFDTDNDGVISVVEFKEFAKQELVMSKRATLIGRSVEIVSGQFKGKIAVLERYINKSMKWRAILVPSPNVCKILETEFVLKEEEKAEETAQDEAPKVEEEVGVLAEKAPKVEKVKEKEELEQVEENPEAEKVEETAKPEKSEKKAEPENTQKE